MMINLKQSNKDLSHINTIEDLQMESKRLKLQISLQETVLREHLKTFPKEAMKAGVGSIVPPIFSGKMAGLALTAGTALMGNFFVKKAAVGVAGIAGASLKKAGMLALGKLALNFFLKRRKKS